MNGVDSKVTAVVCVGENLIGEDEDLETAMLRASLKKGHRVLPSE